MKTSELVTMLARADTEVRIGRVSGPLIAAGVAGLAGSSLLMLAFLGLRQDLLHAAVTPVLWFKLGFSGVLAAAGMNATIRLAQPGMSLGRAPVVIATALCAAWVLAATTLAVTPRELRIALVVNETAVSSALLIAVLALPALLAIMGTMRRMAPTRLRLAGASVGFASGALAALAYALHCAEAGTPFVGTWYPIGIAVPTAIGAAVGPVVLRW